MQQIGCWSFRIHSHSGFHRTSLITYSLQYNLQGGQIKSAPSCFNVEIFDNLGKNATTNALLPYYIMNAVI